MPPFAVTATSHSSAPAALVYAALLDAESWPSWTSCYEVEMELPAGLERPVRVGDLRTIRSRLGGVSCRERIVELVPDQRFSYEQAAGPLASQSRVCGPHPSTSRRHQHHLVSNLPIRSPASGHAQETAPAGSGTRSRFLRQLDGEPTLLV
ncbi:SRPBCC family protein [Streptomyces viridosporus]|uniref:SRPBCC family protein n=1 Tax=Streptomyces viridosporus TaxID=67581 RepID=UPI00341C4170